MMKMLSALILALGALSAQAKSCAGLPTYATFKKALAEARKANNGGLNLDMWGSVVDRSGIVCTVAYTGDNEGGLSSFCGCLIDAYGGQVMPVV